MSYMVLCDNTFRENDRQESESQPGVTNPHFSPCYPEKNTVFYAQFLGWKLSDISLKEVVLMKLFSISMACMMVALFAAGCGQQQPAPQAEPTGPYTADWESLSKHTEAPEWFRNDKFGIYFHWGVYSVPAFGSEWYPRNMHFKGHEVYEHHIKKYGDPAEFGYHDFVPMFKADKFDADEWADLFVQSGARFAGPVAEHHDGFSMWDSDMTPWNSMDKGPKLDITGELATALRKRDLKLVTTFHHARNLQRLDQPGEPYPHARFHFRMSHYPPIEGWPTSTDDPELQRLYGRMPEEEFLKMWKGKLAEVIDKYQPDLIWFDAWLDQIPEKTIQEFVAYYLNRADEQGKDVVITFKQEDIPRTVGIEDYEKGRTNKLTDYIWLTDQTISIGSWCYTEDLKIKSGKGMMQELIDIISKNGQLLLNISPMADGTIPQNQRETLLFMGAWLKKYGEAVYDTRPFIDFGQGPTRLEKSGGFTSRNTLKYTTEDIRYSTKGNVIYAIQMGAPKAGSSIVLEHFGKQYRHDMMQISNVSLLGSSEKIEWKLGDNGLALTAPQQSPDETAIVYKIETNGLQHFVR
jgi:alpha-L-fucosidase